MDKTCEFCGAPRPVVYCQADAAFLCLSCDAKVHSANALSGRHFRTLLCDSCRDNSAVVRCLDHSMLLCRGCESRLHEAFSQHKKIMISSFTGCPSAKHFAALWGFDVNELRQLPARTSSSSSSQFGHGSCVTTYLRSPKNKSLGSVVERAASAITADPKTGFSGQHHKVLRNNHQQEQNNSLIMQQIQDLKRLQLHEGNNQSSLSRPQQASITSSSMYSTSGKRKLNEGLNHQSKVLDHLASGLHNDNPTQGLKGERFPSPISQLDHLSCSSFVGDPFVGNSQFWSQNLQDLGVCEDLASFDDFNIPDVDVTFRNFEDLFAGDVDQTRALLEDDDDLMWSMHEKDASIDKSGNGQDVSAASSITSFKKEVNPSDHIAHRLSRSMEYSQHLMRPTCSASLSRSRLSAESNGSDCVDSGNSGSFSRGELLYDMAEVQGEDRAAGGGSSVRTSNERKKTQLHWKETQLAPLKGKADVHKRMKGRTVNVDGYNSDTVNVTKSF